MKKIITLMFCIGIVSFSFAQYNPGRNDVRLGINEKFDHRYGDNPGFMIQRINRDFDAKIMAIQHDWTLRRHQKKVAIRALEIERRREIRKISFEFHHGHRDVDRSWEY